MTCIPCPKCGEENPAEAVMCWACYTPLQGWDERAQQYGQSKAKTTTAGLAVAGSGVLICLILARRSPRLLLAALSGSALIAGLINFNKQRLQRESRKAFEQRENSFDPAVDIAQDLYADEPPIIRIVNTILLYAVKDNASEIHIEPQERGVRALYRVDGVLREQMKLPTYVLRPLVQRMKIMAEMDILNRFTPQTGKFHFKMENQNYIATVNTSQTKFGEQLLIVLEQSESLDDAQKSS